MRGFKKMFKIAVSLIFIFILGFSYISIKYPIGYKSIIVKESNEYDMDPYLIASIINVESSYDSNAISKKEARGLMQISPQTGKWASEVLNLEGYKEKNLFKPEVNIKIGSWYLNKLFKEFNGDLDLILMAYNAGSGNVNKWLKDLEHSKDGVSIDNIPFKETENYVKRINKNYKIYSVVYGRYLTNLEKDNICIEVINNIRKIIKSIIQQ